MCKLTVIVPVYNTSKYLEKCLNSILEQVDDDVEILVINDGSTDNSREILKTYIKDTKTILYYEKENSGIADTRNYGISKANGKYILFVDSDDYLNKGLLKKLFKYIEEDIDIIKFKLQKVNEKGEVLEKVGGKVFDKITGEDGFNRLAFSDVLLDSPCVYCFKKSLFQENNFKFKVNTEHEDFGLIPLVIIKAKTIISINEYGYSYLQSENSITRNIEYNKTLKRFDDVLIHYDNMIEFIKNESLSENTVNNLKTYYTNAVILKLNELNKVDRKVYIQKIKQRKMVDNIKVHNAKQLLKRILLSINIELYLKLK